MGSSDNFCLRWNDFESNISSSFKELREDSELFDITLCCDNGIDLVHAHKVILAACSPFFRKILRHQKHLQNPFLYLKGIGIKELKAVLNFMYHGEVNVAQDFLNNFLTVAQELAIKGLSSDTKSDMTKEEFSDSTSIKKSNVKRKSLLLPQISKKTKVNDESVEKTDSGSAEHEEMADESFAGNDFGDNSEAFEGFYDDEQAFSVADKGSMREIEFKLEQTTLYGVKLP